MFVPFHLRRLVGSLGVTSAESPWFLRKVPQSRSRNRLTRRCKFAPSPSPIIWHALDVIKIVW